MKKYLFAFILLISGSALFAYVPAQPTRRHTPKTILQLVNASDVQGLEAAFQAGVSSEEVREKDTSDNTLLHLALNYQVFTVLWNHLDVQDRDWMLQQRNSAGETPMMAHIMYGHEKIVTTYFPHTPHYARLKMWASAVKHGGIMADINREKMKEEWKNCCQVGGQDMRSRALSFWRNAAAYGEDPQGMRQVVRVIDQVAPRIVLKERAVRV